MLFFKKKTQNTPNVSELISEGGLSHIAFIMDGNGRWALARGLAREQGHKVGAKVFEQLVEYCSQIGISYMTVYAFSTENWKRPQTEVDAIFALLSEYLDRVIPKLASYNVRIRFVGDASRFPAPLLAKMQKVERMSERAERTLMIALNYGSQDEIVYAARAAAEAGEITKESIEAHLYTAPCPPPDLIVRTGGEYRLSNFLLWQAAYAEFYFTKKWWPDMRPADVDAAVLDFYSRRRRYGGVVDNPKA